MLYLFFRKNRIASLLCIFGTIIADEIVEPHPDMNIKVAAFTVSKKSSNTPIFQMFGV